MLTRKKTVLVDFDLRNPRINQDFELDASKGRRSYILGKDSLAQITHQVKHSRSMIPAYSSIPPNPENMLMDEKIGKLLTELKEIWTMLLL